MKLTIMCEGLRLYIQHLNANECSSAISSLGDFIELLEEHKNDTLFKIIKKATNNYEPIHSLKGDVRVSEIKSIIVSFMGVLEIFSSKQVINDFRKIISLLEIDEGAYLSDYLSSLRKSLEVKNISSTRSKETDMMLVSSCLKQLEDSLGNRQDFEHYVEDMRANRNIRLRFELKEIANQFYGVALNYKNKKLAFDLILKRFNQDEESNEEIVNVKNRGI